MRKPTVIILTLALLLSLCACGKVSEPDLLCGTYVAECAYLDANEIPLSSMFPEGFEITLRSGGKCEININSGKYSGSWRHIDSSFHAEGAGASLDGTIGGGVILLEGVLGSDLSLRLVCGEISTYAREQLLNRASLYDYEGCWVCEERFYSTNSNEDSLPSEALSDSVPSSFELSDAGKAVYLCCNEGFKAEWATSDAGFILSSDCFSLSFALSGEDEVTCTGDGYSLLFRRTADRPQGFGACDILYYSNEYDSFPCINFSDDQTVSMSTFMLCGRYLVVSDTLYGTVHNRQGIPQLASVSLLSSGEVLVPGSPVLIDADCEASYLNMMDGRLYYIRSSCTDDSVSLVSCLPDGSSGSVIYPDSCRYLQAHDGRLWFTDSYDRFVSCLPDGSDFSILDYPAQVCSPYFIDDSRFIYQSGLDGQCLHIFDTDSGNDIRLTYHPGLNPVISESSIFYATSASGAAPFHLCRLDLSFVFSRYDESSNRYFPVWNYEESSMNCSSRFALTGTGIISYDAVEYPLSLWMTLEDSSWQIRSRVPQYVGRDYLISYEYDSDSVVSHILISSLRLNDSAALPRI